MLVSNPYVDESEPDAKLLLKHFVDISRLPAAEELKWKAPTDELRPSERLRKIVATVLIKTVVDISSIPTDSDSLKPFFTSVDPGEKKLVTEIFAEERIVTVEKIMSVTEVSSKIHKSSSYKEAILHPIHARQWKEAIKDEIQNLKNHQTWEYKILPDNRTAVRSK